MPAKVPNVAWKCPQCGKRRWLKPFDARQRKYCSRACQHEARKVEHPVREKRGARLARYGVRTCPVCQSEYEAKSENQKVCSQSCQIKSIQARRKDDSPDPRPCENCGTVFTPRRGSAGRFCSRPCTYEGSRGEKASQWKGGRHVAKSGYAELYRPDHPKARGHGGYVAEHIIVMEESLGRPLGKHETVHHINGIRDDNRIENLQIRSGRHGKGWVSRCGDCGSLNIVHEPLPDHAEAAAAYDVSGAPNGRA